MPNQPIKREYVNIGYNNARQCYILRMIENGIHVMNLAAYPDYKTNQFRTFPFSIQYYGYKWPFKGAHLVDFRDVRPVEGAGDGGP